MARAGVLGTRRFPDYKDVPGERYHYPKRRYQKLIASLVGSFVLFYEPRRGGTGIAAHGGGRSAFTGGAFIDHLSDDPESDEHGYAYFRFAFDFNSIVRVRDTRVSGKALQWAVLEIPYAEAERIVGIGMAVPTSVGSSRIGLTDTEALGAIGPRAIRAVTTNRKVRDPSFRYRIVERVYKGVCALSGIHMTNGLGRAEADAAHIRPVEHDGPDTVRNGLALSKSLHWVFDRGYVSLADDGRILTVERGLDPTLRSLLRSDGYALLPSRIDEQPHPAFLKWHRENVYKGVA